MKELSLTELEAIELENALKANICELSSLLEGGCSPVTRDAITSRIRILSNILKLLVKEGD